jgi:hypothetical protein
MLPMRSCGFVIRSLGLALATVALLASPASAHGTSQAPATDYKVRVIGVEPARQGVQVRAVNSGSELELRNDSDVEVTVLGYDAEDPEPYLRIGPDGVFRNRVSPATFWNARTSTDVAPPPEYDATKSPEWVRISDGNVVRWHDHRAHYQGGAPDPEREQVMLQWEVPLRVGNGAAAVRGDVRYLPPPSAVPYLVLAAVLALGLVIVGRTRAWAGALRVALALVVIASAVQVAGEWGATSTSAVSRVGEHTYVFLGIVLGVAAFCFMLVRSRRPYDATPLALLAGVALTLAGGLSGLPFLVHQVVPTTLPVALARLLVAISLGAGVATIVIAAIRLRRPYDAGAPGSPAGPVATTGVPLTVASQAPTTRAK